METIEKTHEQMTSGPIPLLLRRLCIPTVLTALLPPLAAVFEVSIAAAADPEICGALGIAFPIHAAIQTIGFVFGTGAGSLIANVLGEKDTEKAHRLAFGSLFLSTVFSGTFAVFCLIFQTLMLQFLGASRALFGQARIYAICLLAAAPIMCFCFVLSNLLRAEGKTVYAMVGLGIGNLTSIVVSALLVLYFNAGIFGIGISIPAGYGLALLILLLPYCKKQCLVSLSPAFSKESFREGWQAAVNGLPSLFRQGLTVVAVILLNRAAGKFGDAAVAAVALSSRVFLLFYALPLGIGQGMVPAIGFNYGGGNRKRAVHIYQWCVAAATVLLCLVALPTAVFAAPVLQWFGKSKTILPFGIPLLRSLCLAMPLHGLIAVTNLLLQALKRPIAASILAAARQGIFFLPLIFTLPARFGFTGIWLTQPLADICTFLLSLFFALRFIKKRPG